MSLAEHVATWRAAWCLRCEQEVAVQGLTPTSDEGASHWIPGAPGRPCPYVIEADLVERDGRALLVAVHTGEILDVDVREATGPFAVRDLESAEWVLGIIAEERANVEAAKARASIVLASLEAQEKRAEARVAWFVARYGAQLAAFAQAQVAVQRGRGKFVQTLWGKLQLKRKPRRLKVNNEDAAIAWAREHCPDAVVVTEAFHISRVPVDVQSTLTEYITEPALTGDAFEVVPEVETLILPAPGKSITIEVGDAR